MYLIIYVFIMLMRPFKALDTFHKMTSACPPIPKYIHYRRSYESFPSHMYEQEFLQPLPIVHMYPAGVKGYYNLGAVAFLKENYDMSKYIICGASAGAWNSIAMAYKGSINNFCMKLLKQVETNNNVVNIYDMQRYLKSYLLDNYVMEDFDFSRTYLSVCVKEPTVSLVQAEPIHRIVKLNLQTHLYTDFKKLSDVVDCCIASSNIPLITGPRTLTYDGYVVYDGGFNREPFFDKPAYYKISPSMWENNHVPTSTFYAIQHLDVRKSYMMGYQDCMDHHTKLNELFN